jgi:endoglucanase Acf2
MISLLQKRALSLLILCLSFLLFTDYILAQSVTVGKGSYSTVLPAGRRGPQYNNGAIATPKVSATFNQLINTNDYWTSLIFPYSGHSHTGNIYAHPLTFKSSEKGFELGYSPAAVVFDRNYHFPASYNLTVGMAGLNPNQTVAESYGDWTFTARMENEITSLMATTGHGLPYTFFDVKGGAVQITPNAESNIWYQENEVIGLTVDGIHYGLFAPSGSEWTVSEVIESNLNGKEFVSIAVLPDNTTETLAFFRKHAYAQVIDSKVSWNYDELTANLTSTFTYQTVLRDSTTGNLNETLTALYRHQWLNTSVSLTNYTYNSPRGLMKVFEGNIFTTSSRFSGILPALPDLGEYDRIKLLAFVQNEAQGELRIQDTYNSGKQMGRYADLIHIADQLGAVKERDFILSELKERLEDWFTVGGQQEYSYVANWNTLIGYPGAHGSSAQINDHHFHWAYAIKAAAVVAMFDADWASQENWGGMVNLLIKDANNWDRNDNMLPFLRNFDPYAGHGWAAGHGDFNDGNNQESSSESMNFATAAILWGEITNQKAIRDLGIFLYTNENEAIEQYWFDIDNEVFPENYAYSTIGMVWSNGAIHNTWFGSRPEFIHGINMLPIHGASLYLGKNTQYILDHYNRIVSQLGSEPTVWKDIFWQYLSMSDADLALSKYQADQNYEPFDGNTRSLTMHWLYNMKTMGQYNTQVTADMPIYAVFVNQANDTTYIAYNATSSDKAVSFSDGFSMSVPAKTMKAHQTNATQVSIAAAPTPSVATENVMSIFSDTYPSTVSSDFNPNEGQSTIASIVSVNGNNTLKYSALTRQSIIFASNLDVESRSEFHIDYFTDDADSLKIYLADSDGQQASYDISVSKGSWQSLTIKLSDFSGSVALNKLSKIIFNGSGTLYLDNIFFSGETSVTEGPSELVEAPEPIHDASKVVSLFSNSYNNVRVDTWSAGWDKATVQDVTINGNDVKYYTDLIYAGVEFTSQTIDGTNLTHLHFDMFTYDPIDMPNTFNVKLVDFGANGVWSGGDDVEHELKFNTNNKSDLQSGKWVSFDIPLDDFVQMTTREHLSQLLFLSSSSITSAYIDNVYFYDNSVLSSIDSNDDELPSEITLAQNYPNPFNPTTQIRYSLPEASFVSLEVYNMLGQQVRTLVSAPKIAGNYTVSFDAATLPGGVYFYTLKIDDTRLTKKMMLLK